MPRKKKAVRRRKPAALRVLNEQFETDLSVGALFRKYRELGEEILTVCESLAKHGFKSEEYPRISRKDFKVRVTNYGYDD